MIYQGPDSISARMLRETAEHISPSLTKNFKLSIKTRSFLSLWKKSNIVPIPKAKDNHNYRPISLLSILGKVLENHVHHIIAKHVSTNPQFANVQWGFQSGKSTVTALLETTYDWFQTLDSGKEVCAVFFDIQKAFDIIPLSPTAWLTDSIINAAQWQQRSQSLSLNSWMYPSSQAHMTVGYSQLCSQLHLLWGRSRSCSFLTSRSRAHLRKCFEDGEMKMFPVFRKQREKSAVKTMKKSKSTASVECLNYLGNSLWNVLTVQSGIT